MSYTSEQKTGIVLEMLKEEETVARIATRYQVTSQTLNSWKRQFLANASLAFEPAKALQEYKDQMQSKQNARHNLNHTAQPFTPPPSGLPLL